jgi:hypothetical protein
MKGPGLKLIIAPSSVEVKNKWNWTSTPLYGFAACKATSSLQYLLKNST